MDTGAGMRRRTIKLAAKQRYMRNFKHTVGVSALWAVPAVLAQQAISKGVLSDANIAKAADAVRGLIASAGLESMVDPSKIGELAQQVGSDILLILSEGIYLAVLFVLAPLTFGTYAFYTENIRMQQPKIASLFEKLGDPKRALRAWGGTLWYMLLSAGWLIGYGIGPALLMFLSVWSMQNVSETIGVFAYMISTFASAAAVLFAFVRINAMQPALFLLASEPELGVFGAFRKARGLMKEHIWEFFRFRLSFLLWDLAASMSYGLVAVLYRPFLHGSVAQFVESLQGRAPVIEMPPQPPQE